MNGNLIIKNASELVTCSGFTAKKGKEMSALGIIADGAVVIEQGKISRVGGTAEVMAELTTSGRDLSGFETVDASGQAVLPGFVDSHTHLVFGGYRADEYAWRLKGDSYMDILQRGGGILSTGATVNAAGDFILQRAGWSIFRHHLLSRACFKCSSRSPKSDPIAIPAFIRVTYHALRNTPHFSPSTSCMS